MAEFMTTLEIEAGILKHLEFAIGRDIEKDGDDLISAGLRSTTEIAKNLNPRVPVIMVARILDQMCLDGRIDWYGKIEGMGNVSFWRLALNEDNDSEGQPVVNDLQSMQDTDLLQSSLPDVAIALATDFDYWFPIAA